MEYLWGVHQTTWELHHYFGDPAMKIWTAQPTVTTATHDTSISAGGTSLQITGSNCPGGLATLVYEDTLVAKTTLAGDGTGTLTFDALSGVEPVAILTISKHNFKPYIANIGVEGGVPPVADFIGNPITVMATGSVQFTDQSINSPTSWSWTFEGGTPATSTEQNPVVIYNTPGTYNVTLEASNINGSDTETKVDYITVTTLQPPVADFTASDTNISEGDSITFTDSSTNNPTSWSWSFPGGTPSSSTEQNPTITYNTEGTYNVTLTATNGAGSDEEIKVDYITVTIVLPTVGNTTVFATTSVTPNRRAMPFTMPEDGTIQNVTMYHEGGSGGLILGVYDGATLPQNRLGVTAATPINSSAGWQTIDLATPAFVAGGTTVWLAWVYESIPGIRYQTGTPGRAQSTDLWAGGMPDPFGTSTLGDFLYSIYASYMPSGGQPPVANFTADKTTVDEGDSVNFTDQSTNNPDTWDWTFNGGTPATSTAQNPTVTYSTAGTYTVTLVASNSYGSDTETKVDYITVQVPNQPPTADFTFTTTDLTADFTDTSTDSDGTIVGWDWDFGDGNTSTAQNPSHTYAAAGTYTVTLTVTDDDSATDSVSKPVTVTEPANVPPTADFTFTTTDLTANFTDTSTDSDGTIVSWLWNFGDGNTSTVQNPGHTYAAAGTYTVTLTVTDDDSATDSVSKPVTVTAGNQPPTADFTFTTNGLTANFTDTSTDSDGTIVSWLWNFGDGNTSTVQNPGHTYAAAGTYTVTLTVTDDDSATDTTSKPVTVTGPVVEIYVYDITQTIKKMGRNYESDAAVTIRDTNNNPVTGATVSITWSGVVSGSYSGVTAADGTVTFKSDKVKSTGPFTITVNNVTHATLTYNPTLNIETSDTAYY
jgi:PKD repeat protein